MAELGGVDRDRGEGRLPTKILLGYLVSEARSRGDLPAGCVYDVEIKHELSCSQFASGVCDCKAAFWAVFYPKIGRRR